MFFRRALILVVALLPGVLAPRVSAAPRALARRDLARDTLAWVGERGITALDLVERIELMPWQEKASPAAAESAQVHALQSLVGEKLLAAEAEREGLGRTGAIARMRHSLLKALARDALYREVTAGAPAPSSGDVERIVARRHPRPAELPALRRAVADSLRQSSRGQRAAGYLKRLLAGQRAVVDSAAFMELADSLRRIMRAARAQRGGGSVDISPDAPDMLLARLAPDLERPLARLPGAPYTIGEALEDLRFYPFGFHSLERRRFALEMNAHLRLMVENELVARAALRRHFDQRPEVRHDLEMWSDMWSAQLALERVVAPYHAPAERREAAARYVAGLAQHGRVEFNYVAARSVSIAPVSMLTRRYLGFGGGMLAAPALTPLWDWVPQWRAARRPLP